MSATTWRSMLTMPVSLARDHIRGPIDAPVTLLEYGDYECPFCGAAHAVVNTILAQVGDAVRFVFRHFPMTTVHPHAELAAEAAEAAASQQRFWDMHDCFTLTSNSSTDRRCWPTRPPLLSISTATARKSPGICICRRSVRTSSSGVRSGVNGTPTFFINGVRHDGGWDYNALIMALQRAAVVSAAA